MENYLQDYETSAEIGEVLKAEFAARCEMELPVKDSEAHKYKYTDIVGYLNIILPAFKKHGLMLNQPEGWDPQGRKILTTWIIHAKSGQWRKWRSFLDVSQEGNLNDYQEKGSALTYQKRQQIKAIFALEGEGEDDDAACIEPKEKKMAGKWTTKWIDKEKAAILRDLIKKSGDQTREKKLCDYYKIEAIYKLPEEKYQEAIEILQK